MTQYGTQSSPQTHQPNPSPPIHLVPRKGGKPVSSEDISKRAYQKFLARGSVHGLDKEDWAEAKRELTSEAFNR
jgi:hypothetical protein